MEHKMSASARKTGPSLHDGTGVSHQNIQDKGTIKKSTETIEQLREENRRPRRKLVALQTEGDHMRRTALVGEETCSRMQGKETHATLQQQVFSKSKLLNSMKHTTKTLQQHLDELKMEHDRLKQQQQRSSEAVEDVVRQRRLENSLETSRLKLKLVQSIAASTQKLIDHFKDQSRTHEGQLDALEAEILKERGKLQKLQIRKRNAQLLKDACQAEQQQQQQKEELLLKDLREKKQRLGHFIKKLQDVDGKPEKTEKKLQPDEMSIEAQGSTSSLTDEKMVTSAYEEAFRLIKDSTGITDVEDLVECFASQKDTLKALDSLKIKSEREELELAEQLTCLKKELEEVKHQGVALLFSEQQNQEERRLQLQAQQQRSDAAKRRLDSLQMTLSTARNGVECLAQKLQHIELSEQTASKVPPDSPEFILELLTSCKRKLQLLYDHLEGKDLDAIMEEMKKDKDFQNFLEKNLPDSNVRIKLPDGQTPDQTKDEDMHGVDEDAITSRETLKKKSQLIFESNAKKNTWKKKTTRM